MGEHFVDINQHNEQSSVQKDTSKPAKEVRQYTPGRRRRLGKMPGWPHWPGIIIDPAHIPPAVRQQQRPNTSAHCIRCFPMGDYGWYQPKDVSSLQRHQIDAFLADGAKKRNSELREGYQIPDAEKLNWDPQFLSSDEEREGGEEQIARDADSLKTIRQSRKRKSGNDEAGDKPKKRTAPSKPRANKGSALAAAEKTPRQSNSKRRAFVKAEAEAED